MTNLIVIDLTKLITYNDELYRVTNYYKSIGVPVPTSKEATPFFLENSSYEEILWYMNRCEQVNKIWINPDNGFVIAYEDKKGYAFSENFINHLNEIEPLEVKEEDISYIGEMDIDSILDKISKSGIESLTKEEKNYLDCQ
jgi:hypothetical protein